MRPVALFRLNPFVTVIAAMTGFVVWKAAMHAAGASTATEWVIASVLAAGLIAAASPEIVRGFSERSTVVLQPMSRGMLGGSPLDRKSVV